MTTSFQQLWSNINQSGKLIIAAAVILAGVSVVRSCGSSSKLDQFRKTFEAYKDSVATVLAHTDSLQHEVTVQHDSALAANHKADSLSTRITVLSAANDRLHHKNDSLATIVLSDTTLSPQARQLIVGLRVENDSLRGQIALDATRDSDRVRAIGLLEGSLAAATKRGNTLDSTLRNLPKTPRSEHLLGLSFLPRLTPTATFFVGVGLGAIGHAYLEKKLH